MHPMQDLFLESFSYELQLDMHSYLHKNFILAKSGCYTASMAQRRGRRKRWRSAGAVRRKKVGWAAWAERPDGPAGHWADWAESEGKILF
jgi:hypothetical protein